MRFAFRALLFVAIATALIQTGVARSAQDGHAVSPEASAADQNTQPVPPYHKSAKDALPLPRLLPASEFSDRPLVAKAYHIASEIPLVLAQQPCYCGCNREFGHTSLLDCFTSTHTAGCGICMRETFLAYRLSKEGKTPAEIREAIIRGDWKKLDLNQVK